MVSNALENPKLMTLIALSAAKRGGDSALNHGALSQWDLFINLFSLLHLVSLAA